MRDVKIEVQGMVCSGCENRIKNALSEVSGIVDVDASAEEGLVTFKMDDNVDLYSVKSKIEDLGFDVGDEQNEQDSSKY